MNCPKGCVDGRGNPVVMQGGKIKARKEGRYIRHYCPKCFHIVWLPERREMET